MLLKFPYNCCSRWVNVPEGARDAINKEAVRRNEKNKLLQEKDKVVLEQVKKEALPVKRNEHVVSYVDVMRNYSQDLVRKKKEEEERRGSSSTPAAHPPIPPSSVFPTEALASDEKSGFEVKREEMIKGVIIKGIVCTPQVKGKNKKSGNPFEKRAAPSPPLLPQSEPKTKPKVKNPKSSRKSTID